jgi:hypothetical protein
VRKRGLVVGVLALSVAALAFLFLSRDDVPLSPATASVATSEKAMLQCMAHDVATLAALRKGTSRLAVVVTSFQPATPAAAALVVSLLTANGTRRQEVARFAIHPPKAFSAPATPHRFLVSLEGHGTLIEDGQPLCVEVGFATSSGAAVGGAADIEIGVVTVPGSPVGPDRR